MDLGYPERVGDAYAGGRGMFSVVRCLGGRPTPGIAPNDVDADAVVGEGTTGGIGPLLRWWPYSDMKDPSI